MLFFIRRRWACVGVIAVCLAALFVLMRNTKTGFVPDEDTGSVMISMDTPSGTSLNKTNKTIAELQQRLMQIPEIEYSGGVGGWSFSGMGPSMGMFFLSLKPWDERTGEGQSAKDIANMIYGIAQEIPDANVFTMTPPMIPGYGMGSGFELYIQDKVGGDINELKQVSEKFVEELNRRPEIEAAYTAFNTNYPQYWVDVDFSQCERAGISPAEVLSVISGYYGGEYASNFNRFSKLYRVMMQADPATRVTPESLKHFYIRIGDEMAPLSQFVTLTKTYGPQSISRFNLYNAISINGTPAEGYSSGDALKAVDETAEKILSKNYGYEFGGISREESSNSGNTVLIFAICGILVYLILSALYESLIMPLCILISIPAGLMGSFLFAKMFGLENNIYLQTGLIMLIGLLAKTAILITEYAGERRKNGMTLKQSAVGAAKARLRPILMTALTMVFGMLPLMFASGVGANGNSTLGTGTVGGMIIGTLVLLFLVPGLWMIFQSLQEKIRPKTGFVEKNDWAIEVEKEYVAEQKNKKE